MSRQEGAHKGAKPAEVKAVGPTGQCPEARVAEEGGGGGAGRLDIIGGVWSKEGGYNAVAAGERGCAANKGGDFGVFLRIVKLRLESHLFHELFKRLVAKLFTRPTTFISELTLPIQKRQEVEDKGRNAKEYVGADVLLVFNVTPLLTVIRRLVATTVFNDAVTGRLAIITVANELFQSVGQGAYRASCAIFGVILKTLDECFTPLLGHRGTIITNGSEVSFNIAQISLKSFRVDCSLNSLEVPNHLIKGPTHNSQNPSGNLPSILIKKRYELFGQAFNGLIIIITIVPPTHSQHTVYRLFEVLGWIGKRLPSRHLNKLTTSLAESRTTILQQIRTPSHLKEHSLAS
ncbi:CobB/CobQ domain-containing protein glutamine amidotransferase [Babesia caballi]|uniref:CobB/CobQ domain-containing protein glutamine amidotransferase n=1 Tax=Babesia caballi TaxID=5871 RepID=A0AAV4LSA6_BABCB|nr:CobB/CobQ domain-containing protein glutamine amidotransferase [Babesia caballi]